MNRFLILMFLISVFFVGAFFAEEEKEHPKAKIIMLGNSLVGNADWKELLNREDVHGAAVSDFTSHQLSWILNWGVFPYEPEICFIYSGLEDVLLKVELEVILQKYENLVNQLTENKVSPVVQSTLYLENSPVINQRIKKLNQLLKEYCAKQDIPFLDINKALSEDDHLSSIFTTDGMNLNKEGYQVWASYINAYLRQPEKEPDGTEGTKINFQALAKSRIDRIINDSPKEVNIVMLGNSITENGKDWNKWLSRDDVRNSGQGGYTSGQLLWFIDTCVIQTGPKACFILAGVNDMGVGVSVEMIFENFQSMIFLLQKNNITPVVQSTFFQRNSPGTYDRIKKLNELLEEYCEKNKIFFIDLNEQMSDENGLIEEYTSDGTHLTDKGYEIWSGKLKSFISEHQEIFN